MFFNKKLFIVFYYNPYIFTAECVYWDAIGCAFSCNDPISSMDVVKKTSTQTHYSQTTCRVYCKSSIYKDANLSLIKHILIMQSTTFLVCVVMTSLTPLQVYAVDFNFIDCTWTHSCCFSARDPISISFCGIRKFPQTFAHSNENVKGRAILPTITIDAISNDLVDVSLGVVAHNRYREMHSVPSLILDNSISQLAQKYASYLASIKKLQHSGVTSYGENLYRICGNFNLQSNFPPVYDYSNIDSFKEALFHYIVVVQSAADSWYNEIYLYNYAYPVFSTLTGHFTQLIWKSTKRVGFGVALDRSNCAYVVAIYMPPGNHAGQFVQNVLPKRRTLSF